MDQILGPASPSTCGRAKEMEVNDHLVPGAGRSGRAPFEARRGRHAPRLPVPTRVAAVPKARRPSEPERQEGKRRPGRARRGWGWPAFSHDRGELATLGERPQAPEACVGPRPGGMTVRFGHRRPDVRGARAPPPPACPTQHASRRYLQIPAGRLQEEASPVLLGTRHRHELPQRLLPVRHLRPVCRPNRSGRRCTASAPPLRSARGWTLPGRAAPARRPRPTRCFTQSPPCGKRRSSAPSGGRSAGPQPNGGSWRGAGMRGRAGL